MVESSKLNLTEFEFEEGVRFLMEELDLPESVARQMMGAVKGELESFAQVHDLNREPSTPVL
jgi:hypothetical protein